MWKFKAKKQRAKSLQVQVVEKEPCQGPQVNRPAACSNWTILEHAREFHQAIKPPINRLVEFSTFNNSSRKLLSSLCPLSECKEGKPSQEYVEAKLLEAYQNLLKNWQDFKPFIRYLEKGGAVWQREISIGDEFSVDDYNYELKTLDDLLLAKTFVTKNKASFTERLLPEGYVLVSHKEDSKLISPEILYANLCGADESVPILSHIGDKEGHLEQLDELLAACPKVDITEEFYDDIIGIFAQTLMPLYAVAKDRGAFTNMLAQIGEFHPEVYNFLIQTYGSSASLGRVVECEALLALEQQPSRETVEKYASLLKQIKAYAKQIALPAAASALMALAAGTAAFHQDISHHDSSADAHKIQSFDSQVSDSHSKSTNEVVYEDAILDVEQIKNGLNYGTAGQNPSLDLLAIKFIFSMPETTLQLNTRANMQPTVNYTVQLGGAIVDFTNSKICYADGTNSTNASITNNTATAQLASDKIDPSWFVATALTNESSMEHRDILQRWPVWHRDYVDEIGDLCITTESQLPYTLTESYDSVDIKNVTISDAGSKVKLQIEFLCSAETEHRTALLASCRRSWHFEVTATGQNQSSILAAHYSSETSWLSDPYYSTAGIYYPNDTNDYSDSIYFIDNVLYVNFIKDRLYADKFQINASKKLCICDSLANPYEHKVYQTTATDKLTTGTNAWAKSGPWPPDPYFVVIADTHIGAPGANKTLEDFVTCINSEVYKPRGVIVLGDVSDWGADALGLPSGSANLEKARDILKNLTIPCYFVPGNHDCRIWGARMGNLPSGSIPGNWDNFTAYNNVIPAPSNQSMYAVEYDNALILCLNSGADALRDLTVMMPEGAGITDSQLAWARQMFANAKPGQSKILVEHHPLTANQDGSIVQNYNELINLCKQYDVTVIAGHTHMRVHENVRGVNSWQIPSLGYQKMYMAVSFDSNGAPVLVPRIVSQSTGVSSHSPVHVGIVSTDGKVSGIAATGMLKTEIPGTTYLVERDANNQSLEEQLSADGLQSTFTVRGFKNESYQIVAQYNANDKFILDVRANTTQNQTDTFVVNWNGVAQNEPAAVTVKRDLNSDGTPEITFTTDNYVIEDEFQKAAQAANNIPPENPPINPPANATSEQPGSSPNNDLTSIVMPTLAIAGAGAAITIGLAYALRHRPARTPVELTPELAEEYKNKYGSYPSGYQPPLQDAPQSVAHIQEFANTSATPNAPKKTAAPTQLSREQLQAMILEPNPIKSLSYFSDYLQARPEDKDVKFALQLIIKQNPTTALNYYQTILTADPNNLQAKEGLEYCMREMDCT